MKLRSLLGLMIIAMGASCAQADEVRVPVGQQAGAGEAERPRAGMDKDGVEARFGAPVERRGPVGDPPISAWEYQGYVVYFEHNTVLHSVVKHQPRNNSN